jgi:serine/threonine protein kinase
VIATSEPVKKKEETKKPTKKEDASKINQKLDEEEKEMRSARQG